MLFVSLDKLCIFFIWMLTRSSPTINRFTLDHEIGHVLENTKSYNTMQDKVINTYKTKVIFDIEMKDMADLYQGIDTTNNIHYLKINH